MIEPWKEVSGMSDPSADLLETVEKIVDAFVWQRRGPLIAAMAVLAQPLVADGLAALPKLAAVTRLHAKRTWADGTTVVCAACNTGWPCPTAELLEATT